MPESLRPYAVGRIPTGGSARPRPLPDRPRVDGRRSRCVRRPSTRKKKPPRTARARRSRSGPVGRTAACVTPGVWDLVEVVAPRSCREPCAEGKFGDLTIPVVGRTLEVGVKQLPENVCIKPMGHRSCFHGTAHRLRFGGSRMSWVTRARAWGSPRACSSSGRVFSKSMANTRPVGWRAVSPETADFPSPP